MQNLWKNYGKFIIAGAVAIVLGTGGYKFWEAYTAQKAAAAGDAFMEAVQLTEANKQDEALEKLKALEAEGSPAYLSLARLRAGSELAKKGDKEAAVKEYDAVAADGSADENLRAIARIRAAMLMVDTGSVTDVEARVGPLAAPGAPYRASAREALALAYYKAGDLEKSSKLFVELRDDQATPPALGQRARLMIDLIASQGGPKPAS
jgi:hypothetical protein